MDRTETHHTVRGVLFGTVWRVLRYPFLAVTVIVLPRMMGPAVYGQYAVFLSVFMLCDAFVGLGNVQVFGRFIPEMADDDDDGRARLLQGMMAYGLLSTLPVIAAASGIIAVVRPEGFHARWLVPLGLILVTGKVQGTLFALTYGMNQVGRFSARDLFRSIFSVIFVVFGYFAFGLDGAIWALVLNELALVVVAAWWTRRYCFRRVGAPRFADFRAYLLFGFSFYVATLLLGILQRSGNVLIQALTGRPEQVAYFDIANQFLMLSATLLGLIPATLLPAQTRLYTRGESEKVNEWNRIVLIYCGLAACLTFAALQLAGRPAIELLIGPSFAPASRHACVMSVALLPILMSRVGMNIALLKKRPGDCVVSGVWGVVVMVVSALALIRVMGGIGASWAVLLGQIAMTLVYWTRHRADFRPILGDFFKVIAVGLLFAPLYMLDFGLWQGAAAFAAVATGMLALLAAGGVIHVRHLGKIMAALRDVPKPPAAQPS